MAANCIVQQDDTTAGMKGATPDSVIMTPASDVSQTFSVGPNCVWLYAHGLTGTDTIRVMMVSGPGAGTHVTPFRPTGEDPPADVVLSVGRTALPIYYPGRYRLHRLVGATTATVYAIKTMVAHDAGRFYADVTGDTVVNSIDAGTISPAFEVDFDPTSGDVVFDLGLNLSVDAGNIITEEVDGIFATAIQTLEETVNATKTVEINITPVDTTLVRIGGNVVISADAGNLITAAADGLYATGVADFDIGDTATINLDIDKTDPQLPVLTANATISPDAGNLITAAVNGLYAALPSPQVTAGLPYVIASTVAENIADGGSSSLTWTNPLIRDDSGTVTGAGTTTLNLPWVINGASGQRLMRSQLFFTWTGVSVPLPASVSNLRFTLGSDSGGTITYARSRVVTQAAELVGGSAQFAGFNSASMAIGEDAVLFVESTNLEVTSLRAWVVFERVA